MQISLTGDEILILFFLVVALYGLGWIVVNKIIPAFIRRGIDKRKREREALRGKDKQ